MKAYAAAMAGLPKAPRLKATGKVYFLADGDYIKIGFTTNWDQRREAYRTHSARRLRLLLLQAGTREDEKALHRKFKHIRINGEWFRFAPEVSSHIKRESSLNECLLPVRE